MFEMITKFEMCVLQMNIIQNYNRIWIFKMLNVASYWIMKIEIAKIIKNEIID